jgi:hypothetical protein
LDFLERHTGKESFWHRRVQDEYSEPLEKVFQEFERDCRIIKEELIVQAYARKKMRAELHVHLKERAGMTYREMAQSDLFADLELSSMGCIYRRAHLNRPG